MAGKQFSVEKFMRHWSWCPNRTPAPKSVGSRWTRSTRTSELYPAIDGAAMTELMDSIQANGLLETADGSS